MTPAQIKRPTRISRVDPARIRVLGAKGSSGSREETRTSRNTVVYWMSRECRTEANWGLLHADDLAREMGCGLCVAFCLTPSSALASPRAFGFMLRGLSETAGNLLRLGIPFFLLKGSPPEVLPRFAADLQAAAMVTDFDPLRIKLRWLSETADALPCPLHEVDSRNIVPCRFCSDRREYAAYTIRPKILRSLSRFLVPFPPMEPRPIDWIRELPAAVLNGPWLHSGCRPIEGPFDPDAVLESLQIGSTALETRLFPPGGSEAVRRLTEFVGRDLGNYSQTSRRPEAAATSRLSPYLHFGQISSLEVALAVIGSPLWPESGWAFGGGVAGDRQARGGDKRKSRPSFPGGSAGDFLEELIVRRELADNFCLRCDCYDTSEAFPDWASATLERHWRDKRDFLYSEEEFETAATHDPLWNAAQRQLLEAGFIHGYMRMYWAKKMLEWSEDPESAMNLAILLNDRYGLDGCDPNGYAGIAWSIGGVHDRAWPERPVFGKIRYMSYGGCGRKFDIGAYIGSSGLT